MNWCSELNSLITKLSHERALTFYRQSAHFADESFRSKRNQRSSTVESRPCSLLQLRSNGLRSRAFCDSRRKYAASQRTHAVDLGYAENTLTRTVDMHVASLRKKLEHNPRRPELIVTVAGVGYRFLGTRNS